MGEAHTFNLIALLRRHVSLFASALTSSGRVSVYSAVSVQAPAVLSSGVSKKNPSCPSGLASCCPWTTSLSCSLSGRPATLPHCHAKPHNSSSPTMPYCQWNCALFCMKVGLLPCDHLVLTTVLVLRALTRHPELAAMLF